MSHKIEPDYEQGFVFPPYREDWLRPDHPVRDLEAKQEESREAEGSADLGTDPWALAYA